MSGLHSDLTKEQRAEKCHCGHTRGNHRWFAVGGKRRCYATDDDVQCDCLTFVAEGKNESMTEQEFVDILSPRYKGLDSDGESETDYDEGWNDAADECAQRIRKYFPEIERLRTENAELRKRLTVEMKTVRLPDDVELLRRASQVPYLLENYRAVCDDLDDYAMEIEAALGGEE